ncbi:MAG: energy-coupling factor transporter transmembrane protein EcfT [Treponema sp.]|jgi:energy-coupling factor transport system permease protein|nr:energy-coupling factor transporter transmembrane protein EcfT [Treponema sp.]
MRLSLDPRSKLLILVLVNIFIVTSPDLLTETAGVGLVALAVLAMGSPGSCVKAVLIYAGMLGILHLCGFFPNNPLSAVVSMIIICFRKIAPPLFFAGGMIATTKAGELVSAMQKLRIPKPIVITFAVTLRFFPTAKEEFAAIRDAMRLRGIGISAGNVLTRPLTVMECVLIPMMMRCATIAEELSAAAVTRGIESGGRRSSINELRMRLPDYIASALFVALVIFSAMGGVPLLLR